MTISPCLTKRSQFTLILLGYLLIAPSFILKSTLIWVTNYMVTLIIQQMCSSLCVVGPAFAVLRSSNLDSVPCIGRPRQVYTDPNQWCLMPTSVGPCNIFSVRNVFNVYNGLPRANSTISGVNCKWKKKIENFKMMMAEVKLYMRALLVYLPMWQYGSHTHEVSLAWAVLLFFHWVMFSWARDSFLSR